MSPNPFEPCTVGLLEIRNRFVRSATFDGTADNFGAASGASEELYRQLGRGGAGLIITGFAFVSDRGRILSGQYGVHTDDMIPGLRRLARAAHQGRAKIALQIAHGGIKALYPQRQNPEAPAVSRMPEVDTPHREMNDAEIETVLADFAAAAGRAREAGFDGVQFHGAHGYLMNQFLSPLYNSRTDRWGGSADNRQRFYLEAIRRARRTVGADYPLMIKFGVQDDVPGGLALAEGLEVTRAMVAAGIDAIEVSSGADGIRPKKNFEHERANYRERTAAVKQAVSVPVMAVSGIRSLEMAKDILNRGDADMISMCRAFIREPDIVARWQRGDGARSRCSDCDKCTQGITRGGRLECEEDAEL